MNENFNRETSASQTQMILAYMRDGNSITPIEALNMFGSFRLGARIADIAKIVGYPPKRKRVCVKNRAGKDVYVMQYSL